MPKPKRIQCSIYLLPQIKKKLKRKAGAQAVSVSFYVEKALLAQFALEEEAPPP
jgi:hypothetical protein